MFVLEGVFQWVINEVSNANKQLRIIDEKKQYNMRTAEETASLALVFGSNKKSALFQQFFSSRKLTWIRIVVIGNNTNLIRLLKLF